MTLSRRSFRRLRLGASVSLVSLLAVAAAAQEAPIVQPGAPGQDGRALSAEEASRIAGTSYTQDDVRFMQDMIPHHQQAVDMSALVQDRTATREIVDLAGRITASQDDEIDFMQAWLEDRGEAAPEASADHPMHTTHQMAGMATPEQMAQLAASEGADFDRLYLELMIPHHEGAVEMVEALLEQPGSAYDPVLYEFVNDIVNDQTAEIERMNAVLASLSPDPRAVLKPGFRDADEAIWNLTHIAALPKPAGFFDPANPAGLPPKKQPEEKKVAEAQMQPAGHEHGKPHEKAEPAVQTDATEAAADAPDSEDPQREDGQSNEGTQWGERSPLLSFSNTDMAFAKDILVAGNYHGFNIYKLDSQGVPQLQSSIVCPGGQGDVSIVGDLLIMSVEQTRGRVDCGLEGVSEKVSDERFRGLRIFNIADLTRPKQVGQVQTCRGSHTHSVVSGPGEDGKIIVYNSGTASIRDEEELEGCVEGEPGDQETALFRIDVVEIPVDDPSKARIVDSPAVFADPETGRLAGLWRGGDHGDDTQRTRRTDHCHDITVFPAADLAAGACSGNGIIFDISDPYNPKRIDEVVDKGFAYWHSATFNNDGTKVLFTDEWGGGSRPRCRASDPQDWGADAIYDIVDDELRFGGHYKMSAPQAEQENCVAHNGSVVPVPGRDIFVQAWYQGGLSVIDFTDSANPVEIAYFDRGPIHEEKLVLGGYWSTYWYDGRIYGTEIARGLDVFALEPSDHLSENEIAAAALADQGEVFNPQQQFQVTWPAHPTVARAYMDQLARDEAVPGENTAKLRRALDRAHQRLDAGKTDASLARELEAIRADLPSDAATAQAQNRLTALKDTLSGIADRLRRQS